MNAQPLAKPVDPEIHSPTTSPPELLAHSPRPPGTNAVKGHILTLPKPRSSLFKKVPQAVLSQIDRAVAGPPYPTYQEVFDRFELSKYGVSFRALARYARRLRHAVAAIRLFDVAGLDLIRHQRAAACLSREILIGKMQAADPLTLNQACKIADSLARLHRADIETDREWAREVMAELASDSARQET